MRLASSPQDQIKPCQSMQHFVSPSAIFGLHHDMASRRKVVMFSSFRDRGCCFAGVSVRLSSQPWWVFVGCRSSFELLAVLKLKHPVVAVAIIKIRIFFTITTSLSSSQAPAALPSSVHIMPRSMYRHSRYSGLESGYNGFTLSPKL